MFARKVTHAVSAVVEVSRVSDVMASVRRFGYGFIVVSGLGLSSQNIFAIRI